jgi:hypothetical protein
MKDTETYQQSERDPHSSDPVEPGSSDVIPIRKADAKPVEKRGLTPPDYDEYGSEPQQDDEGHEH